MAPTRRDFLRATSGALAASLAAAGPRAHARSRQDRPAASPPRPATADAVIVLWMAGGMPHTETFDPKRYAAFRPGLPSEEVLSTFPSIPTAVDGLRFSQGLEEIAAVMDRGTVLRSHVLADLGFILHSRHQYHWHTGYEPPLTVAAPHLGAWIAQQLGPRDPVMPAFIDIGQPYEGNGEAEELKAFQTGGLLGSQFHPFRVPDPSQAAAAVRPPAGMSRRRFRRRQEVLQRLMALSGEAAAPEGSPRAALEFALDRAHRLLDSPRAEAFDLQREPAESLARYDTGRFGRGCLLARRLVEAGARFVEVSTEYVPFLGWDTHDNGHTRVAQMKQSIDRPIASLVRDLEDRGLLDTTLIVLASEFSRDILMEGKPDRPVQDQVQQPERIEEEKFYGMHRHFTAASSVLLFGGGVPRGHVHGRTADERPCAAVEDPVSVTDLHATVFAALGISPRAHVEVERRPFYVTKDGLGAPVPGLLA